MTPLTIYEWMLINGDELADAIKTDGKIDGPASHPLLNRAQAVDRPGRTWNQARRLLRDKLRDRGMRDVIPEDER